MTGKIYITDVIGEDTGLLDVVRQVKSQKNATEFIAVIDSVGGYVDEGFAIYEYLKNLPQPVNTYAKKAYSIASVIFMSGQRRIADEGASDVLMIHLPSLQTAGNLDQLTYDIGVLKDAENRLVNFYSTEFDLPKETVHRLLANETFLNTSEALELGLVTETKAIAPAMALFHQENNTELESTNWMKNFMDMTNKRLDAMARFIGIKAELTLQDATGLELVFPDLSEGETPFIDDTATVDGKPAEGEFIIPSLGQTLKFQAGVITEMEIPADTQEHDDSAENADDAAPDGDTIPADEKDARIAELEAENAELKAKIEELEAAKNDETQDKLLSIIEASTRKIVELEKNYNALAQSVGSNFIPTPVKPTVSATLMADENERPSFSMKRK